MPSEKFHRIPLRGLCGGTCIPGSPSGVGEHEKYSLIRGQYEYWSIYTISVFCMVISILRLTTVALSLPLGSVRLLQSTISLSLIRVSPPRCLQPLWARSVSPLGGCLDFSTEPIFHSYICRSSAES